MAAMPKPLPAISEIGALLAYCPASGAFMNRVFRNAAAPKFAKAGSIAKNGYVTIRHNKRLYLAHRMAWLFAYGNDPGGLDVDHINGDVSDNRISNLRLATRAQNLHNSKTPKTNTSGQKGVYRNRGKWVAYIRAGGKRKQFGAFASFDEARAIYLSHEAALRGDFARTA